MTTDKALLKKEILTILREYEAYKKAFAALKEAIIQYSRDWDLIIDMDNYEVTDWGKLK